MSVRGYEEPDRGKDHWTCLHCGVLAGQDWQWAAWQVSGSPIAHSVAADTVKAECRACGEATMWHQYELVRPHGTGGPPPNEDLPPAAHDAYEEARSILGASPRGAAALLRLTVQLLCVHLGQPGKNINADIGALVTEGLPVRIQQALDVVRVVGNNAVHPGQIEMTDNIEIAAQLFTLVNLITDAMISQPKHIAALYESLPASALEAIDKRDG